MGVMARVWNDNVYDFVDKDFKGSEVRVPAGGYTDMALEEACEFLGKFHRPVVDGDGVPLATSYKKLRKEILGGDCEPSFACNLCKMTAVDQKSLDEHSKLHASALAIDPDADAAIKRGRGRPPKEATA